MRIKIRIAIAFGACFLLLCPSSSKAQSQPTDLIRVHGIAGVLQTGDMASATFIADFTSFGGDSTGRTDGKLDVDPSFLAGLEGTYRLNEHFSLDGTWLHSRGRLRVTFPALSRDPGDFDLEGFVLAASDFTQEQQIGGSRAESAMSDAISDFFMVSGTYEASPVSKRFYPYASLGGGIMRQVSDGPVFKLTYEGAPPPLAEFIQIAGGNWEELFFGLPNIYLDETNFMASIGAGVRIALGSKWSADFQVEDLICISPDLQSLEGTVPPPDPDNDDVQRVFAVTVVPEEASIIHNIGIRFSFGYAVWPFGAPR